MLFSDARFEIAVTARLTILPFTQRADPPQIWIAHAANSRNKLFMFVRLGRSPIDVLVVAWACPTCKKIASLEIGPETSDLR